MPLFLLALRSYLGSYVTELSILLLSDVLSLRQFFGFFFFSAIFLFN
jgi:hypothetical protein